MRGWANLADQLVAQAAASEGMVAIPFDNRWAEKPQTIVEEVTQGKKVLGAKGIKRLLWDSRGLIERFETEMGLCAQRDGECLVVMLVRFKETTCV